jgi:hypothetical protein
MLLLSHKDALELTLSTQHKGYDLNPQISQREVGESQKSLGLARIGLGAQQSHQEHQPSTVGGLGIYTPQRRKLAISCRAAPVRPIFEKLVVGLATPVRLMPLTGQAGQARGTPKPFLSLQHFTKEMKWLRLA